MAKVYCEVMQDIQIGPIEKHVLPDGRAKVFDYTKLYKKGQFDWFEEKVWKEHDFNVTTEYPNKKGQVVTTKQGELRKIETQGPAMQGAVSSPSIPLVVPETEAI